MFKLDRGDPAHLSVRSGRSPPQRPLGAEPHKQTPHVRIVVAASTLTAAAGLGSTLLVPSAATGIIGFGLLGIGLGPVVPTVVSAAAGADLGMVEHVVSRVFTLGYFGSASGPAIIGYTAGKTGLRAALLIPLCLVIFIAISARRLSAAAGLTRM